MKLYNEKAGHFNCEVAIHDLFRGSLAQLYHDSVIILPYTCEP